MATTLDDIAALLTEQNSLLRRVLDGQLIFAVPDQPMGSISKCIPPTLCGDDLHAALKARQAEIRSRKRRAPR